jgi:hypothetical protein
MHTGFFFPGVHLVGICRFTSVKQGVFVTGITSKVGGRVSFAVGIISGTG